MKKLFLFTILSALTISLASCSGDDDSGTVNNGDQTGGTVSFKLNGVQKTFNSIQVTREPYDGTTWLTVTASENGNPTEFVVFAGPEGQTGAAQLQWSYTVNNATYSQAGMNNDMYFINTIIETNSNNKIKGSFTGSLTNYDFSSHLTFTDGTINITYKQ